MVTVARTFTKLVDEDFGWKDPKAAERAGMSMMDYVIGGMDRSFKLKLLHTLHAAEAVGLSPGTTSAFRDDYRQSIASGLKAARIMAGAPAVAMGMGLRPISGLRTSDGLHPKSSGSGLMRMRRSSESGAHISAGTRRMSHRSARNMPRTTAAPSTREPDVKKVKRVAIRDDPSLAAKRPRTAAASKGCGGVRK
jgi:hypothetical protein